MYKIFFEDGTIFEDDNPYDSKWNEMPIKLIEKIEYTMGLHTIVLSGFLQYNHIVDRGFIKQGNVVIPILNLRIMGSFMGNTYEVVYDTYKNQVLQNEYVTGKETKSGGYSGWKQGKANLAIPSIRLKD